MAASLIIKNLVATLWYDIGSLNVFCLYQKRNAGFVLMYHRVLDSLKKEKLFVQPGMYVKANTFRQHVNFLKKNFNILPLTEILARLETGRRIGGCCAITFDDGWHDNFINAYPILKEFQIPATIFLATGFIGTGRIFWPEEFSYYLAQPGVMSRVKEKNKGLEKVLKNIGSGVEENCYPDNCIAALKALPAEEREDLLVQLRDISPLHPPGRILLNWQEAKEMHSSGLVSFGAHTANHVILDQVSLKQAEQEIVQSRRDLEKYLGVIPDLFAYPNGNYTIEIRDILKKHRFKGAVTTKKDWVTEKTTLLEIPRIGMHEDVSRTIPLFFARILLKSF